MSVYFSNKYLLNLSNNIKWTKELPTKEGFYWVKDEYGATIIGIEYDDCLKRLVSYDIGWDCYVELDSYPNSEWYGPLPLPK